MKKQIEKRDYLSISFDGKEIHKGLWLMLDQWSRRITQLQGKQILEEHQIVTNKSGSYLRVLGDSCLQLT